MSHNTSSRPRRKPFIFRALILSFAVLTIAGCKPSGDVESRLDVRPFGTVRIFRQGNHQRSLIVLYSDAQGWSQDMTDLAWNMAAPDRMVVGLDLASYRPSRGFEMCSRPGADLATLVAAITRRYGHDMAGPLLVAKGAGGSTAFAAASQELTPVAAAILEDFCPVLPRTPCAASSGMDVTPVAGSTNMLLGPAVHLKSHVIAIADPAQCTATDLRAFVQAMPDARIVAPMKDKEQALLLSVVTQTNANLTIPTSSSLADLPLIELPPAAGSAADDRLAVLLSGDGGWADIDKTIGEDLARKGIAVVGFDTLKYFWQRREPADAAADLAHAINHYLAAWHKDRLVLIGFSYGASVLPFMEPYLGNDIMHKVVLTTVIAPEGHVSFEVNVGGWIGEEPTTGPLVAPAIDQVPPPVLCIYPTDDEHTPCPAAANDHVRAIALPGGHHFGGDYGTIADRIIADSTQASR